MLPMRSLYSAAVLYSNSYYTVVASIFLVSTAFCKAICRVASVRSSDYSQPKWHTLLVMPHVLIKYAHVLICISVSEGSQHFSAFHLLPSPAWVEGTALSLCVCLSVCLSVCLLPQNCYKFQLSQNLNKLQITNLVI